MHSSDIQLLDRETVLKVLAWKPTIVFASGPPLYLSHRIPETGKEAFENALLLARNVDTLILDHHLLRSFEGYEWLKELAGKVETRVLVLQSLWEKNLNFLRRREKFFTKKCPCHPAGMKPMQGTKLGLRTDLIDNRVYFLTFALLGLSSYQYREFFRSAVHNNHRVLFPRRELQAQSKLHISDQRQHFSGKEILP